MLKTILLYLCDSNKNYLSRLSDFLNRQKNSPFIIKVYTEKETLLSSGDHQFYMLVSSHWLDKAVLDLPYRQVFILCSGEIEDEYAGLPQIYKYQSARQIYERILEVYMNQQLIIDQKNSLKTKETDIIGIYSPQARIGKTTFAIDMGKRLSREYKTLYMTLEDFSEIDRDGECLSDLINAFKQGQKNLPVRLCQYLKRCEDLDLLRPADCRHTIDTLDAGDWEQMMGILASVYEKIIIDIGGLPGCTHIFEMCDQLYMPYKAKEVHVKIQHFFAYLEFMGMEHLKEKIIQVDMAARV